VERIELLDVCHVRFAKHRTANVVRAPAMASDQCDGRSVEEGVQVSEIMHLALMTEARNCCQNAENIAASALTVGLAARITSRLRVHEHSLACQPRTRRVATASESPARITPACLGEIKRSSRTALHVTRSEAAPTRQPI
jgi:hypothetical protein